MKKKPPCRPSSLSTFVIVFIYIAAKLNIYNHKTNCLDIRHQDQQQQAKPNSILTANNTGATLVAKSPSTAKKSQEGYGGDLESKRRPQTANDNSFHHFNVMETSPSWWLEQMSALLRLIDEKYIDGDAYHWLSLENFHGLPEGRSRRVHRNKRELTRYNHKSSDESDESDQDVVMSAPRSINETKLKLTSEDAIGGPIRGYGPFSRQRRRPRPLVLTSTPSGLTDGPEDLNNGYYQRDLNQTDDRHVATTPASNEAVQSQTMTSTTTQIPPPSTQYDIDGLLTNPFEHSVTQSGLDDSHTPTTPRSIKKSYSRNKQTSSIHDRVPGPEQNPLHNSDDDSGDRVVPQVGDLSQHQQDYDQPHEQTSKPFKNRSRPSDSALLDEQKRIEQLIKISENILANNDESERNYQPSSNRKLNNDGYSDLTSRGLQLEQSSGFKSNGLPPYASQLKSQAADSMGPEDYLQSANGFLDPRRLAEYNRTALGNRWSAAQRQLSLTGGESPTAMDGKIVTLQNNADRFHDKLAKKKLRASGSLRYANVVAAINPADQQHQNFDGSNVMSIPSRQDESNHNFILDQVQNSNINNPLFQSQVSPVLGLIKPVNQLGIPHQPYFNYPLPRTKTLAQVGQVHANLQQPINLIHTSQPTYSTNLGLQTHQSGALLRKQNELSQAISQFQPNSVNRLGSLLPNPVFAGKRATKAQNAPSKRQLSTRSTNNRLTRIATNYDEPSAQPTNSAGSSATTDPVWSDSQNQEDDYQQSPQTIQITAVPNGLVGNGWNGWNGVNGVNGWNGWGGPWNGRQVLLVNRQPTVGAGVGSEWRQWALPIAIILALPLVLGALFVPVFLKSVMFLIQILQMLGLLMPPHQLAGHLASSSHGASSG